MKLKRLSTKLLLISLILAGISQKAFPDPYVYLSFLGSYSNAYTPYNLCDGDTKTLYATIPPTFGGGCAASGTFQWYYQYYGTVCEPAGGGMLICGHGWATEAIDGETSNSYTVTSSSDVRKYFCIVDCGEGAYSTDTIEFRFAQNDPAVSNQPVDATICNGSETSFTFTATGDHLQYQWQEKPPGGSFSNISGVKSRTYTFTPAAGDDQYQYKCRVSNGCATVYTDAVTLDIKFKPSVTQNPSSASLCEGLQNTYSISATGDGLSYTWQRSSNGGGIWGDLSTSGKYTVSNNQLTVSDIDASMTGDLFRCVVTGDCSPGATSSNASLDVKTEPVILVQPAGIEKCIGDTMNLTIEATGTAPLEYYWRLEATPLGDWTTSFEYTIDSIVPADAGSYDVKVRNECNTEGIGSDAAVVGVNTLPDVELGDDEHICEGSEKIIDPGSAFATYSWNTGETTQTVSVTETDTLVLTVANDAGCLDTDSIIIFVDPAIPELDLGEDTSICMNSIVQINAPKSYDSYNWSTGMITDYIQVFNTGNYILEVTDEGTVCTDKDTVHVLVAEPYDEEELCLITIDLETGRNAIVFEKTPDVGIQEYNIYRETDVAGDYGLIGSIPVDSLTVFVDEVANPEEQQYLYKISAVDTCGNESEKSSYHKTLFLQYVSSVGGVNLRWDKYEIEGVAVNFDSYEIYRGSDSSALAKVKTISGSLNSWTDTDPVATEIRQYYRIAGVKGDPCDPANLLSKKAGSGPYSHSMSNLEDNRLQTVANLAPTDITLDNPGVDEEQPVGTLIGRFSTDDPDEEDVHTYALVSGDGDANNLSFMIKGDSLLAAEKFDFETKINYSIRVKTTDSEDNTFEKQFVITVSDVDETVWTRDVYATNMNIYPNPFTHQVTIEFVNPEGKEYTMYVRDLTGKLVHVAESITDEKIIMDRGDMINGYYFIELRGEKVFRGTVIIE